MFVLMSRNNQLSKELYFFIDCAECSRSSNVNYVIKGM